MNKSMNNFLVLLRNIDSSNFKNISNFPQREKNPQWLEFSFRIKATHSVNEP